MNDIGTFSDTATFVIDSRFSYDRYTAIDLSVDNKQLDSVRLDDPDDFGKYIAEHLKRNSASAAYGGYNEKRNLYRTSAIFTETAAEERNIHIGIDIWIAAGTAVLSALDGIVHSVANNVGTGNYGPTVILKHIVNGQELHTLYGHLSIESIADLTPGTPVRQGQQIGTLGDYYVNGGYPPHLHFQLIRDLGGRVGDYPGVCGESDREFYLNNCPDPNLLLKIKL